MAVVMRRTVSFPAGATEICPFCPLRGKDDAVSLVQSLWCMTSKGENREGGWRGRKRDTQTGKEKKRTENHLDLIANILLQKMK